LSDKISVALTTRNNLEYLKLCLRGLKKHSSPDSEILVHVDGSTDGTVEWLEEKGYDFTHSKWRGTYSGWNTAVGKASNPYMILYSDDMFCAPNFDVNLLNWSRMNRVIVPRLVEPALGSYLPPYNCGRTPKTFEEDKFIKYAEKIEEKEIKPHAFGAFSLSTHRFRDVGGFDTRFDPYGVGSIDLITTLAEKFPDMKFYEARDVILYHFQRAAISKIPNMAKLERRSVERFEEKWGFGVDEAYRRLEAGQ